MKEKFLKTRLEYKGGAVGFRCDEVFLSNGKKAVREYLTHPGAVGVVAFLDDKKPLMERRVLMVQQFRYPIGKITLEIPAGKLSLGEDPLKCVQRELQEETGYRAQKVHKLLSFWPTAAFANEIIHLYYTEKLSPGKQNLDEDEFLDVKIEKFGLLIKKIKNGKIADSKTIIALLSCAQMLNHV